MIPPLAALVRHPGRPGFALPLLPGGLGGLRLAAGRVHEAAGPARRTLAALTAGSALAGGTQAVLWILPAWLPERPMPGGLAAFCDPGRLVLALARRAEDLLWAAEEGLRAGAAGLVVAELVAPPSLTAVRRLHLAAGAAAEGGMPPPVGLLLLPGAGGAPGVESRWHLAPHCTPLREAGSAGAWRLCRLRARRDPPAAWRLSGMPGALELQRDGSPEMAG